MALKSDLASDVNDQNTELENQLLRKVKNQIHSQLHVKREQIRLNLGKKCKKEGNKNEIFLFKKIDEFTKKIDNGTSVSETKNDWIAGENNNIDAVDRIGYKSLVNKNKSER